MRAAYTYTLLHALIGSGADRFAPLGFEDGRLDGGAAATLAGRDGTGVLRVLFVNRSDVLRTARVDVNGASKAAANVLVLDDPAQPPHGTQPAPSTIVVPARSIVLAELGAG